MRCFIPIDLGSHDFLTVYFRCQGYYDTMDAGIQDEEGYVSVMSRTDDVINVAGHRLSCGHIEEVDTHRDVFC